MIKKFLAYLIRNRIEIILVMGLSVISLFLCMVALTNSLVFKTQVKDITDLFRVDMGQIGVMDFSHVNDEENFAKDIGEIKNTIRNDYGLTCAAYTETYLWFDELWNNEAYLECNRKEYKGTFYEEDPDLSNVILVEPEIMDLVCCGIKKEELYPQTIDGEVLYPIYVGIDFKDIIKIDDVLTGSTLGTRYIVKGYMQDANWFSYFDPFAFPASSVEHKFITSFGKEEQADSMTQLSTVNQIFVEMDANQNDFINDIEKEASKKDIKIRISTIADKMQMLQDDNQEIIRNEYGFAAVVMICSMISISSLFCAFILMQKKEYGIRMAFGEFKERLICIMAGRHLAYILGAMFISLCLAVKYMEITVMGEFYQLYYRTLMEYALPVTLGISILYTLISLIPPILMINRMELVQLVKEEGI